MAKQKNNYHNKNSSRCKRDAGLSIIVGITMFIVCFNIMIVVVQVIK